ncbi:hypothetical protein D3C84_854580 [compost metagenome]
MQQLTGRDERRRNTHQGFAVDGLFQIGNGGLDARGVSAAAEKITRVQIRQIHIDIVPLVRRLADDATSLMSHRAAFLLAKDHQATEQ